MMKCERGGWLGGTKKNVRNILRLMFDKTIKVKIYVHSLLLIYEGFCNEVIVF